MPLKVPPPISRLPLPLQPWVGRDYAAGGVFGKRVAIVAELRDQWPLDVAEPAHATTAVITRCIEAKRTPAFWADLARILLGRPADHAAREALWQSVCVCEFSQNTRATKTELAGPSNQTLYLDMLAVLQPALVVVIGSQVWRALPPADAVLKTGEDAGLAGELRRYASGAGNNSIALYLRLPTVSSMRAWRLAFADALLHA